MIRPSDVSPAHPQTVTIALVKQTLAGKIALAVRRRRRRPRPKAWLPRVPDLVGVVRDPRAVVLVPVGPGDHDALYDTLDSVRHHEPDALIVVLADGTTEMGPEAIGDALLLRPPRPSGGPPRLSPPLAWAYRWILDTFAPDVVLKLDTDALLIASGLLDRAAKRFAAEPSLAMLGDTARRRDGTPGDTSYGMWVLAHERRWSRSVRRVVRRAEAAGWKGEEVHGGAYLLAGRGLRALERSGHLDHDPPWWTLIGEDLWFALGLRAAGMRIGRLDVIATAQGSLPVDPEDALEQGLMAVHSVRRGRRGETEAQLRAFFRAARQERAREHA